MPISQESREKIGQLFDAYVNSQRRLLSALLDALAEAGGDQAALAAAEPPPESAPKKRVMNRKEFAEYVGISTGTHSRMLRRREVSCVRLGARVLFTEKHAEELLAKKNVEAVKRRTRIVT